MYCKNCGIKISRFASVCKECGTPIRSEKTAKKKNATFYDSKDINNGADIRNNTRKTKVNTSKKIDNREISNKHMDIRFDKTIIGWILLGLTFPAIGFFIFLIKKKSNPSFAIKVLTGTVIGAFILIIMNILTR